MIVHLLAVYVTFMKVVLMLLNIYVWIILAYCLMSMIIGFDLAGARGNRFVMALSDALARLVEPALQPVRRLLPETGIMDFSPIILLLVIEYAVPYGLKQIFRMIYAAQAF